MIESSFQRQLAGLILRYDEAMRAPKKVKDGWEREWNDLLARSQNPDQCRRANELLALHGENKMYPQ